MGTTEAPHILRVTAQLVAGIRLNVPAAEIRAVMMPGLTELRDAVAAQGVPVTGPWFTWHFRRPAERFDFMLGLPVAGPVRDVGRVRGEERPAATVARTVHHGGYEGLAAAWGALATWMGARGVRGAEAMWECYAVGPESGLGPEGWRTELNWVVLEEPGG